MPSQRKDRGDQTPKGWIRKSPRYWLYEKVLWADLQPRLLLFVPRPHKANPLPMLGEADTLRAWDRFPCVCFPVFVGCSYLYSHRLVHNNRVHLQDSNPRLRTTLCSVSFASSNPPRPIQHNSRDRGHTLCYFLPHSLWSHSIPRILSIQVFHYSLLRSRVLFNKSGWPIAHEWF